MKPVRLLALALFGAAGCGDIGAARLDVSFPDSDTEDRTKALLLVVREVRDVKVDGCQLLWSTQAAGVAESRSVVEYPNRNDVLAAPVNLSMYPNLTLLVYAYPSNDVTASRALAGGCVQSSIKGEMTQDFDVPLKKAP